ncbi:HAD superfamily hydrolase (TIGR01509 family) [Streptomyces canus]|nr:HAD superfamily hydrolase (TIGR01509 family) [Streptomyces canus]
MTSDTTQTVRVTAETENAIEKLRELVADVQVVLWDFDGPICRLFAGHSAVVVAKDLVEWLAGQGLRGLLTEEEREHPDPMAVLYAVHRRHPRSDLVTELEERLTQQELKAVGTAMPTAFADPLIRTWLAVGARFAVTTNNSPRTVREYLADRDLTSCFDPHIYGRTLDLSLLKPHPYCLERALRAMGVAASSALMIGDSPADGEAARQAGVPFLGYARNEEKAKHLREAGAACVVHSFEPVLEVLRGQA